MRCRKKSLSLLSVAGEMDQELKKRAYVGARTKDKVLGGCINPLKMQPGAYSMSL